VEVRAFYNSLSVVNIADNITLLYYVDTALKPYGEKGWPARALTAKAPAGDNLIFHRAIEMAETGDVIVVSTEGCAS
jgi:regulator of RNase E activity RraA